MWNNYNIFKWFTRINLKRIRISKYNWIKTFSSIRPHHGESDDLNTSESNNPHRIGSNIPHSISPSYGEQDNKTSNRSNESRFDLTEPASTNKNGFEETGLCVPTIQNTKGSNSLNPSNSESLRTSLEGSLQNYSVHDYNALSIDLKYLESNIEEVSDLMIAQMITELWIVYDL